MVKTKRMNMTQKYIEGDIVEYDNKIMIIKKHRDGNYFDLSCPKEGFVCCFVGVDKIKPVDITPAILERNGWDKEEKDGSVFFFIRSIYGR